MTDAEWHHWFGELIANTEAAVDRLSAVPRDRPDDRERALADVHAAQAEISRALDTHADEGTAAGSTVG